MRNVKFGDFNDSHTEQYKESLYDDYQAELDSGIPTEWIIEKSLQTVDKSLKFISNQKNYFISSCDCFGIVSDKKFKRFIKN